VWATVLIHLFLLFGLTTIFLYAVAVSIPLALLRVPPIRRWWDSSRRLGTQRALRVAATIALASLFVAGCAPLVQELAVKGGAAFVQHPNRD
jgi:hypothetical protein